MKVVFNLNLEGFVRLSWFKAFRGMRARKTVISTGTFEYGGVLFSLRIVRFSGKYMSQYDTRCKEDCEDLIRPSATYLPVSPPVYGGTMGGN
ncbi:MAG: hypothetical protein AYP45_10405 [Candidatus Brocadia carolinensis]|uniref:Uncharacterized protein n=1 Tax=Candidatus Brocadia carolinensis TaxID=1004156 RepID=A0A1V4ASR9_9BACT|nr:MAG: hypothetical protein AYP45_10405 [Candidatus Brocadia caroliniensis]